MATSGSMVTALAQNLGQSRAKVESVDRSLSEAGLRTTGGKGRSAAKMTGMDVVNVMFPLLMNAGASDAPAVAAQITKLPKTMSSVRNAPASDDVLDQLAEGTDWSFFMLSDHADFPLGPALSQTSTFGETLALLVDAMAASDLTLPKNMALKAKIINGGRQASIVFQVGNRVLRLLFGRRDASDNAPFAYQTCELDGNSLEKLAAIIRSA